MKKQKKFKWVVEFEVDEIWVADGFDLDNDRALSMLSNELQWAYPYSELKAKVIKRPNKRSILKAQGHYKLKLK